ncbi:MAG TPA: hypothetical protein VER12_12505 [Polyangiaceae bacterium]|nr:hypothetical protein [Polyangiaceae bacterium]
MERVSRIARGLLGAVWIVVCVATPFLRKFRLHWGTPPKQRSRTFPGDDLIPEPRWFWCHAIELEAACPEVFPWLVQMGQDKGGFYSYEWLENLVGCEIRNAQSIHPEWQHLQVGEPFRLAPKGPPLRIAAISAGESMLIASPDPVGAAIAVSWLFFLEPLANGGSRLFSRFRAVYPPGIQSRLLYGPTLLEPIGFAMDRALLRGIKQRVEAI